MDRPNSYRDEYSNLQNRDDSIKVDTFSNDPQAQPPITPTPEQITADVKLLRECVVESLKYRSVPIFFVGTGIIYYVNTIKPSPRGIKLPIFLTALGSALLGRFLYRNECAEKFINAKHSSPFVDFIRKSYGKVPSEFADDSLGYGDANDKFSFDEGRQSNFSSRREPSLYGDSEKSQPSPYRQDDYWGDDVDRDAKRSVTYEDLRNQNRAKWQAPAYPMPNQRGRPDSNQQNNEPQFSEYKSF